MVEVTISVAIFLMITMSVYPLVRAASRSFSLSRARVAIATSSQETLNRIANNLIDNKRLFEQGTGDDFLGLVLPDLPSSGAIPLPNSKLPDIMSSHTSASIHPEDIGNSLFFASYAKSENIVALSGVDYRIDTYRFYYYYLATDGSKKIDDKSIINIWEWISVRYADFNQLPIADPDRTDVLNELVNRKVNFAWDPSISDVNIVFFDIDGTVPGTAVLVLNPAHNIKRWNKKNITSIIDITGNTRFGVAPNVDPHNTRFPVPSDSRYEENVYHSGILDGEFPAGFEVVIVQPEKHRQIYIRLVMAAEGYFPSVTRREQTVVVAATDLW